MITYDLTASRYYRPGTSHECGSAEALRIEVYSRKIQTFMLYVISAILGLAAGAMIVYLACRPGQRRSAAAGEELRRQLADSNARIAVLTDERNGALTETALMAERLRVQKEEAARNAELQKTEFKNIATEILSEKSKEFRQTNRDSLELLLKPFSQSIEDFRKRVEEVYSTESKDRYSLKEQIKALNEMNLRISSEANSLTAALKGNSKIQGDWGEMILESILDGSNLVKGVHYTTQENFKDEEGADQRPDVILNLPEGKQIVIDSKVSLTSFVGYCDDGNAAERPRFLKEHLRSVRSHVDKLSRKKYQSLVDSPDFVIMFVPNEPAFLLAMQNDGAIWSEAYNKKVIISSPTNLFALLKLVDDLWKRDNQSRNAIAIAEAGARMYDKFAGFADTMTDLGKSINSAKDKYETAFRQLKEGHGNLVSRAEKLRELGIKANKKLPDSLADYDDQ